MMMKIVRMKTHWRDEYRIRGYDEVNKDYYVKRVAMMRGSRKSGQT